MPGIQDMLESEGVEEGESERRSMKGERRLRRGRRSRVADGSGPRVGPSVRVAFLTTDLVSSLSRLVDEVAYI